MIRPYRVEEAPECPLGRERQERLGVKSRV